LNATGENYAQVQASDYTPTFDGCTPGTNPIIDVTNKFLNNDDCEYIVTCIDANEDNICDVQDNGS